MAHNSCTESTSCRDSVDSCMNEAMLMSFADTVSDELCDEPNDSSGSVATTESILASSEMDTRFFSENTLAESNSVPGTQESPDGSTVGSRVVANTAKRPTAQLILTDSHRTVQTSSRSADSSDGRCCESFAELTNSSIQSSNLWPTLNVLRKRLGDKSPDEDAGKQDGEVMEDFLEMFEHDPRYFTQHLLTILEESSDLWISGTAMDSHSPPSGSVHSDSTRYMSFERHGWRNARREGVRENESPASVARGETREGTNSVGTTDGNSSTNLKEVASRMVEPPIIVLIPSTPRRDDNLESPKNCVEDEDYVTAESEIDEDFEDVTILDPDKCPSDTINLSQVGRHHAEWMETFGRVVDYEPSKKACASSAIVDRTEGFKRYTNKLEKRWMRELMKKRQKCFEAIEKLLGKAAAEKPKDVADESTQCTCDRCKRRIDLYNTLVACSDFYMHACDKRNSRSDSRTTIAKKNRRSLSRTPAKSRKENPSDSRDISTKRATRKSLNKRTKSPGARYKSPRRSLVGVKPSGKKSAAIATRRNAKRSPGIDESSIQPVWQLRKIFSPNFETPGPVDSKMAAGRRIPPRTYGPKTVATIPGALLSAKNQNASKFISPARNAKFRHVKSPVAEYIRGKKN